MPIDDIPKRKYRYVVSYATVDGIHKTRGERYAFNMDEAMTIVRLGHVFNNTIGINIDEILS